MKKDIERLLIYLIPAIALEKVIQASSATILEDTVNGGSDVLDKLLRTFPDLNISDVFTLSSIINIIAAFLPVIVLSFWVWGMEKKESGRPILWVLGSIVLKYWILLLYIGQMIYEKYGREPNKET